VTLAKASGAARPWLPLAVVERRAAQAPFDQALAAWRADWAPDLRLQIAGWTLKPAEPRPSGAGEGWRTLGASVAISCSLRAQQRLAGAALRLDVDAARPNDRDRLVLSGFCDRMLADLAARFDALLGVDAGSIGDAPRAASRVLATIEGDAGVLLQAALPAAPLVVLYHRSLSRPPAGAEPMVDRLKALAGSQVRLEATLGEAVVTLPELRAMAPGDLLRLDRKLTDPGRLHLAGGGFVAHGALTQADGRLALRLRHDS
jgi:flagellar motor switch/type III secretory pathway protein FliN